MSAAGVSPVTDLGSVPAGVQPGTDDRLQCLECGRCYRQLGQHVVAAHKISTAQYREQHELPASLGLHAPAVTRVRAERGRRQWAADPAMATRLRPRRERSELSVLSRRARRATLDRAGVRRSGTLNGRRAREAWIASIDTEFETLAHTSLEDLLTATTHLHACELEPDPLSRRLLRRRARSPLAADRGPVDR
ncbi:MAG: MucR family transcriptional regulator [Actinobacteria bacterium]|nr:MucR family transcriptional regulator [Actinomycetota bacterium]